MIDLIGAPDWPALLAAIRASAPDDDGPRLDAADWLEARGDFDHGEFIRLQCQWAKAAVPIPGYRSRMLGLCDAVPLLRGALSWWEFREMRKIECGGVLPLGDAPCFAAIAGRGFVGEVLVDQLTWRLHGPAIVRLHPVEHARFVDLKPKDCGLGFIWTTQARPMEVEPRGQDEAADVHIARLEDAIATLASAVCDDLRPGGSFDTREQANDALSRRAIRWAMAEPVGPESIGIDGELSGDFDAFVRWKEKAMGNRAR